MEINVSASLGFKNGEMFANNSKKFHFSKKSDSNSASTTLNKNPIVENSSLFIQSVSNQISITKTLEQTLKYLNSHANKKRKKSAVFGELWNIMETSDNSSEFNINECELYDFEISKDKKNIFAA